MTHSRFGLTLAKFKILHASVCRTSRPHRLLGIQSIRHEEYSVSDRRELVIQIVFICVRFTEGPGPRLKNRFPLSRFPLKNERN
ncbi:MAG: hypothetical protein DWI02_10695 [Planctomycetota bacterium]|nr:MAG: hypothetical protein DWI02_10695 [Planctomycetota bacterium]